MYVAHNFLNFVHKKTMEVFSICSKTLGRVFALRPAQVQVFIAMGCMGFHKQKMALSEAWMVGVSLSVNVEIMNIDEMATR